MQMKNDTISSLDQVISMKHSNKVLIFEASLKIAGWQKVGGGGLKPLAPSGTVLGNTCR